MSQLDEFFADASRINSEIRAAEDQADAAVNAQKAKRVIAEVKGFNAGNLAMSHLALRELAKVDPTHPLVRDAALRENIKVAARKVMSMSNNWDDVREFGQNYKISGR